MDKSFQTIEITDAKYPKILKEALKNLQLSSGPKKLYYKGNWDGYFPPEAGQPGAGDNCLAVVGSRHLTAYGRKACQQIVGQLAASGITIVSGFMYGGDESAHSSALSVGGKTIAVMPCGINLVHPENQKDLYEKILKKDGLIISEYEGDAQPQTFTYVQRDRIVAGLCKAVFVLEAALGSGSLITASYAKKYGKKVFALPGQITSELAQGTNRLIKEGAEIVTEANDILSFYKLLVNPRRHSGLAPESRACAQTLDSRFRGNDSGTIEAKIMAQLQRESMKADELSRLFLLPASQIGTTLTLMQLKGLINLTDGKYFIN